MQAAVNSGRVDYLRKQKHWQNEISVDEIPITGDSVYEDPLPVPEHEFDFEEHRLASSFEKLSLLRKRILILTFIEELTSQEVADRLSLSVDYVYLQKHRALKKLRDQLMDEGSCDEKP